MAAAKSTGPKSGSSRASSRRKPALPDLDALLHRLGQSIALIAVAHRSLESQESAGTGQEAAVLRAGIAALNEVYNDLDVAAGQLWRAAR